MRGKRKAMLVAIAAVAVLAVGGGAIAVAAGGGDDDGSDQAISGPALERAKTAALDHTGGGKVTGTEVDDEEGAYEVEVTRADGSQVDVHLDTGFNVLNAAEDRDDKGSGADED